MLGIWNWIAAAAKTVWRNFKKLPGWAIGVILFLIAVIWYAVRALLAGKEISKIQQERVLIEKDRYEIIKSIRDGEEEESDKILKKYDKKLAELSKKRDDLQNYISEGPSGVADAWKNYMKENK